MLRLIIGAEVQQLNRRETRYVRKQITDTRASSRGVTRDVMQAVI